MLIINAFLAMLTWLSGNRLKKMIQATFSDAGFLKSAPFFRSKVNHLFIFIPTRIFLMNVFMNLSVNLIIALF